MCEYDVDSIEVGTIIRNSLTFENVLVKEVTKSRYKKLVSVTTSYGDTIIRMCLLNEYTIKTL